jgi:4-amino-4-deoxy-L-arabinose transferase-like glycosyltransferase/O-antigen ligase
MNAEIVILVLLFIMSLILILRDFKVSLFVLLILSVLLHKQLFSIYQWDFLPIRIFMLALSAVFAGRFLWWIRKGGTLKQILEFLKDPFVILLLLLWLVRGVSIVFTENLMASLFLFAFFTTVVVLGLVLYKHFINKPQEVLMYLKAYILIVFLLSLVALAQFVLYLRYEILFGALWNIPGHWPRVGSLFWDVNHFGSLVAGLLPLTGILILVSEKIKHRIMYAVFLVPMTLALLFTNSRTSWLSAGVGLGVFLALMFIRKFKTKGIVILMSVVFLLAVPLLYEYSNHESPFRARIKRHFHYRIDSFDSHLLLIRGTLQVFDRMPVLGGGYGSFFEQFEKTDVSTEFFQRDPAAFSVRVPAHTIWGELLAETGVIGLFVFTSLVLVGVLPLIYVTLAHKSKKEFLIASAMSAGILGWLVAGIFYSYNAEFFWLVFFFYFIYGMGLVGREKLEQVFRYFFKAEKLALGLLVVLAGVLLFSGLGTNHLLPWDEAIYAKVSKNMISTGDYVVQRWIPDRIWYEKPPLFMWMMAGMMQLFDISEFSARFPSAFFGLATVVLLYFFGRQMFNKTVGFISAFVLLTTFHYLYYARAAMLDVTVTFFITASLFLWWLHKEKKTMIFVLLAGVMMGAGIMVKGVIGFIPLAVIGLYELYLYIRREQRLSMKMLGQYLLFVLASAAIFVPWHWEMYVRFGQSFIDNYIGYHVLNRATAEIEGKGNPVWWYFIVMKVSMRIWFVVLIPAFLLTLIRSAQKINKHVFLLFWSVFIFALFSFSQSKLIWYIIPIYPVAALIVGYFIDFLIRNGSRFISHIFPKIKAELLMMFSLYLVVFGGLSYLLINRSLIYMPDLTGSRAQIIERKDTVFGLESTLYVDLIEPPLVLYYTDGPYELVSFSIIKDRVDNAGPDDEMVFITKESRFNELAEGNPRLQRVDYRKEWVLAILHKELPPEPLLPLPVEHTPIQ